MYLPLFLCLYESFWKGFEPEQRRFPTAGLSNAFACLARRKLLRTLKFRLTFLILLTINFPLTTMRRDEIISQGDQELIVNMKRETKLERLIYDASDY